ncbi:hypothetical protein EJ06DRAFT_557753 [Trichodelitschia bisporula]|uniref:Ubiquitin 3 binding protein But2 C-terminal domain-containing protein n=1 Tax=Trichodelitschia bisporula TaxID=703511 RepID=A0A6G1HTB4_9PEZI|nr:hypothetical protein EJ06DRAFT_557753 [Trichodelitschia bisporula]
MAALAQILGALAIIVMIRSSGAVGLERRDTATFAEVSFVPVNNPGTQISEGMPFTTIMYNSNYAELDPKATSVTAVGTWRQTEDSWGALPTSTVGFLSSIAPLNAIFYPPPACTTQYQFRELANRVFVGTTSSSYPPDYLSVTYYSPGICPRGGYIIGADTETHRSCACFSFSNLPGPNSPITVSWTISAYTNSYYFPSQTGLPYTSSSAQFFGVGSLQFVVTPISIR